MRWLPAFSVAFVVFAATLSRFDSRYHENKKVECVTPSSQGKSVEYIVIFNSSLATTNNYLLQPLESIAKLVVTQGASLALFAVGDPKAAPYSEVFPESRYLKGVDWAAIVRRVVEPPAANANALTLTPVLQRIVSHINSTRSLGRSTKLVIFSNGAFADKSEARAAADQLRAAVPSVTIATIAVGSGIDADFLSTIATPSLFTTLAGLHTSVAQWLDASYYASSGDASEVSEAVEMSPTVAIMRRDGPIVPLWLDFHLSRDQVLERGSRIRIESTKAFEEVNFDLRKPIKHNQGYSLLIPLKIRDTLTTPSDELNAFAISRLVMTINRPDGSIAPIRIANGVSTKMEIPIHDASHLIFGPIFDYWPSSSTAPFFVALLTGAPADGKSAHISGAASALCDRYQRVTDIGGGLYHVTSRFTSIDLSKPNASVFCRLPLAWIDTSGIDKNFTAPFIEKLVTGALPDGFSFNATVVDDPNKPRLPRPTHLIMQVSDNIDDIDIAGRVSEVLQTARHYFTTSPIIAWNSPHELTPETIQKIEKLYRVDKRRIFQVKTEGGVKNSDSDITTLRIMFEMLPPSVAAKLHSFMEQVYYYPAPDAGDFERAYASIYNAGASIIHSQGLLQAMGYAALTFILLQVAAVAYGKFWRRRVQAPGEVVAVAIQQHHHNPPPQVPRQAAIGGANQVPQHGNHGNGGGDNGSVESGTKASRPSSAPAAMIDVDVANQTNDPREALEDSSQDEPDRCGEQHEGHRSDREREEGLGSSAADKALQTLPTDTGCQ